MGSPGSPGAAVQPPDLPAVRVCLCSGIGLYRDGLADSLRRFPGIEVVGVFGDDEGMLPQLGMLRPDVVLLDTVVTGSVELARAIVRDVPEACTVAMAVGETESEIIDWAEAGVSGYVTRDSSLDELVAVIQRVTRGEVLCSPKIAGSLFRRVSALAAQGVSAPARGRLTRREREIVQLIDEGLSNKEIAARLFIELATVKNHVHNILEKLGVGRRSEAAARVRAERL